MRLSGAPSPRRDRILFVMTRLRRMMLSYVMLHAISLALPPTQITSSSASSSSPPERTCGLASFQVLASAHGVPLAGLGVAPVHAELDELAHGVCLRVVVAGLPSTRGSRVAHGAWRRLVGALSVPFCMEISGGNTKGSRGLNPGVHSQNRSDFPHALFAGDDLPGSLQLGHPN